MSSSFALSLFGRSLSVGRHATTTPGAYVRPATTQPTPSPAMSENFVGSHLHPQAAPVSKRAYFESLFERIEQTVDFNLHWHNGTGYLNAAVEGPEALEISAGAGPNTLNPSGVAKSTDNNGRKMIFVATTLGPMLVFQRYSSDAQEVYCLQTNEALAKLGFGSTGGLSIEKLRALFDELPGGLQSRLDCQGTANDAELSRQLLLRVEAYQAL